MLRSLPYIQSKMPGDSVGWMPLYDKRRLSLPQMINKARFFLPAGKKNPSRERKSTEGNELWQVEVRGYKETNNILDSLAREMSENLSKAQNTEIIEIIRKEERKWDSTIQHYLVLGEEVANASQTPPPSHSLS